MIVELDPEAIMLDGLEDAIIGATEEGLLIYSYTKLLDLLQEDQGMRLEDAVEWFSYNIDPLRGQGAGFVVAYPFRTQ